MNHERRGWGYLMTGPSVKHYPQAPLGCIPLIALGALALLWKRR